MISLPGKFHDAVADLHRVRRIKQSPSHPDPADELVILGDGRAAESRQGAEASSSLSVRRAPASYTESDIHTVVV